MPQQRVKLAHDCYSEWKFIPAGVPQGTKLGPWLFMLMIDEIDVTNIDLWKFMDDTTMAECAHKKEISKLQDIVEDIIIKTQANKFQLNGTKCKERRISFAKKGLQFHPDCHKWETNWNSNKC